ncbi:MAG: CDP-alcohol phosphatidyltransferase family protein [Candidatus Taylorbacteria bacterium]|nr:CDP-alcohol phosphatidyltransferase family protein [Candidatus Taylorbacteria bacterium]
MAKFKEKVLALAEARTQYLKKVTPIDRVIKVLFLGLLPKNLRPNQITVFRFASIPFIVLLLLTGHILSGAILFLFSAFSDALDGALARTSGRVTRWGILADPLADKLLVGSAALILVSKYISLPLAFAIVLIEAFTVVLAYFRYKGRAVPAKTPAKIKMVLQCFGIIFLLFYALFGGAFMLLLSTWTLYLAVVFALLSLLLYRSV